MPPTAVALVIVMLAALAQPLPIEAQTSPAASPTPVPGFADPARRARLAAAIEGIEARMPEAARRIGAPGLSWGIVIDGTLAASGAVGLRDVEGGQPAGPGSIFRIASMTKSVTALAILKLRDEGRLALDDAVATHVPEFSRVALPTADAPAITIRHLLTHSAGFPEDNPWGDRQLAVPEEVLTDWLKQGIPFSTSPGTAYEYSNYGFALLGRIVGNVAGVPYGEYIRSQVFEPLGMTSTFWDERQVPSGRLARGYRRHGDGWSKETPLAHGAFGAMGGLYTSIEDLSRYVAFMLDAWPPRDQVERGPVRRSSVREMQQGQRHIGLTVFRPSPDAPLTARAAAYAYGLGVSQDCRFRHLVAHGGGLPGYGSNMMWLPEQGVGVMVFANVTYAAAGGITRSMLEALSATGALEPRRWPASAHLLQARDAVTALVNQWSDEALDALAADNLLLDRPRDRRRAETVALRESLGACTPEGEVAADNWLRGSFRLRCQRGWITAAVTLSPTRPPRVQHLTLSEGRPLSASLRRAVSALVDAMDESAAGTPALELAAPAEPDRVRRQLRAFGRQYGACTLGDTMAGNGVTGARVRVTCARGTADLTVRATAAGAVESVDFRGLDACVP